MATRSLRALGVAALATVGCLMWPVRAQAETITWVDWTSGVTGPAGSAAGTLTMGAGISNVSYSGQASVIITTTVATQNFWDITPAYLANPSVSNAPPGNDIIEMSLSGARTITFSRPVRNPLMAIVSMNQSNSYQFNADFQIVSQGQGHWGTGTFTRTTPLPGVFSLNGVNPGEPHGVIEFQGVFSSISWNVTVSENWNGFTFGIRGFSCTSHEFTPTAALGTDCPYTATPVCSLAGTCVAPLANNVAMPANPSGLAPYDGLCKAADAAVLCASTVCSTTDHKCGYANGDGPCDAGNAATRCRSGTCSVTGLVCIPPGPGGCALDSECSATQYCNTQTYTCAAKLPNGNPIPSIPGHTPSLIGLCTDPVAVSVCSSAVCDTTDNQCGFKNGNGTCTSGTSSVVCRSGACDPGDLKCGLTNGNPCTLAPQCRSNTCSSGGICVPVGGCSVDADCAATEYCNTPAFTCTPKLSNGTAIPTVVGHTPTLDSTCTAAAGTAVCTAGVCDTTDNACGYKNGNGTCTSGTAATVCRSGACDPGDLKCGITTGGTCGGTPQCRTGACSSTSLCIPAGGCAIDTDCAATEFCNTPTLTCSPKLSNGTAIPTVTGHVPAVNGTCTTAAASTVCTAAVCDADNKCGFANGNGACTSGTAATVCRSGACDPGDLKCGVTTGGPCSGTPQCRTSTCSGSVCIPVGGCAVDSDCAATQFCNNPTLACTPKLSNGTAVPTITGHAPVLDGNCTTAVGAAVCSAGVCDASDKACGFANGNGSCTSSTGAKVCRSGSCDADLKCGLTNGKPCTTTTQCRSTICTSGMCVSGSGCTVDADCPTNQRCNPQTHTCQTIPTGSVDAGSPNGENPNTGNPNTGNPDGGAAIVDDGVVEGGGINCSAGLGGGGVGAPVTLGVLGIALGALRLRRRRDRTS